MQSEKGRSWVESHYKEGKTMKVENMNGKSGKVANQFRIFGEGINIFQSYDSTIVEVDDNTKTIKVYPEWDYSRTTGKYRNQFMKLMGLFEM